MSVHPAKSPPVLAGVWQTLDRLVFRIDQSPGAGISTTVLNDSCTGGPRTQYLMGTINNTTLNGTMNRCSAKNDSLVLNCSIPALWSTPFNATFTDSQITGHYRGEFWTWNTTANGSRTNCHIEYYFNASFSIFRIDCGLKSFAQLADQYISDPTQVAPAIDLANQFENGLKLTWTDAQSAPGGFKSKVLAFQTALVPWGITSTVTSAYRPILYQAHFADMRICLLEMLRTVTFTPGDAKYLHDSVAILNQAVHAHALKTVNENAGGLEFDVPFVCWRPPLTQCAHVGERAVDISMQNPSSADSIGALYGFCRPYASADPVHWEYIGVSPWGSPKCAAAGVGPGNAAINILGNSPIDLLVTSPSGQQIGFNASTSSVIDDFGPGEATYSGPGTHPQVVDISSNATVPGNYSVTAQGTGNGTYTITYSAVNFEGDAVDQVNVTGTATLGMAIIPLQFSLRADYAPPSPWLVSVPSPPVSGSTSFSLRTPNGTFALSASSSTVDALMFSSSGRAIALRPGPIGGLTTVTVPHQLLLGPYTVRADGSTLPSTTTDAGSFSTVSFQIPINSTAVTIEGTAAGSSSHSGASAFPWLIFLVVGVVAVALVLAAVAILVRRQRARQPPVPPPLQPPPLNPNSGLSR